MTTAQASFTWMFVGLAVIAGTLFGTFVVSKDPVAFTMLIIPTVSVVLGGLFGFAQVFDKRNKEV